MRKIEYTEYPVPELLSRHIRCAWALCGETEPGQIDTIYPDGCCEIIVHRAIPPSIQQADGSWQPQARYLFAAQQRSAIRLAPGKVLDCIGIRLQPAASAALPAFPLVSLREQVLDLQAVNAEFCHQLRQLPGLQTATPLGPPLWQLLGETLGAYALHPDLEQVVDAIQRSDGNCRIESLAAAAGLSIRQLQMLFLDQVGLAPKEFSRVIRLQSTLRQLDQGADALADLAASSGFADQAHASRELRRMTGLTPARLRRALQLQPHADSTVQLAAAFVRGRA